MKGDVFPCDCCGKCCQAVHLSELTQYLDRGDGACRHLDQSSKLCQIYDTRPEICNVNQMYHKHFQQIEWKVFVDMNREICNLLPLNNGEKNERR